MVLFIYQYLGLKRNRRKVDNIATQESGDPCVIYYLWQRYWAQYARYEYVLGQIAHLMHFA